MIDDDFFREEVEVSLRQATDGQLARIMQFIDRLPSRARLDELVAPMRGRLALAKPARSVTTARALTAPIEDLLVDPACEAMSPYVLPRDILGPFHHLALAAIGPAELEVLDDEAQGATMDAPDAVIAVGRRLWPQGAAALRRLIADPDAPTPENWRETHLARLETVATLLERGEALISRLAPLPPRAPSDTPPPLNAAEAAAASALLRWAAADSPQLGEAVAMIVMRRLGDPAAVAALACGDCAPVLQKALQACLREAELTAQMLAQNTQASPFMLAEALPRLAGLLASLARVTPKNADFVRRLGVARQAAQDVAAARYENMLGQASKGFSDIAAGQAGEDAVAIAESLCRAVAKIAAALHSLGGGDRLSSLAQPWLETLQRRLEAAVEGQETAVMDGLRVVEILFGPDAAETVYDSLGRGR